ncbi:cupin domain-containing protein [Thermosulfuriphilus sp.]
MKIKKERPDEKTIKEMGVENWPIWQCEPSTFDWHYPENETCYILEGEVTVKTADEEVEIGPGDLVTFPKGLDCTWVVKKAIRKHYKLG